MCKKQEAANTHLGITKRSNIIGIFHSFELGVFTELILFTGVFVIEDSALLQVG